MNLEEVSKIPFKEKRALVSEACMLYRKLKTTNKYFSETGFNVADIVKAKNLLDIRSASMFEVILGLLSKMHLEIIDKDFINFDVYPSEWYLESYSKSTYYKLKHEAIDKFLYLLFA